MTNIDPRGRDAARVRMTGALALMAVAAVSAAQTTGDSAAALLASFEARVGRHPNGPQFEEAVKGAWWDVYPHDRALAKELTAYIATGADDPRLGFAAFALVPFHDPASAQAMVQRALRRDLKPANRWALLTAAPFVLSMGDVFYEGDGTLDGDTRDFAKGVQEVSSHAVASGVGRFHARALREIYDASRTKPGPDDGLILWHQSAYLVGTLDLRDAKTLDALLNPELDGAFANVMAALSYASGRNFLSELENKPSAQITKDMEARAVAAARTWWAAYLNAHPDGDWRPAAREALAQAGFTLEPDAKTAASRAALRRAIESPGPVTKYTAYRLLNDIYATSFDLERVFVTGKYALSALDPGADQQANETRLGAYWQNRLR